MNSSVYVIIERPRIKANFHLSEFVDEFVNELYFF